MLRSRALSLVLVCFMLAASLFFGSKSTKWIRPEALAVDTRTEATGITEDSGAGATDDTRTEATNFTEDNRNGVAPAFNGTSSTPAPGKKPRRRALVMIHMHSCGTSPDSPAWGNVEWFLDNGGLISGPTALWSGVDYIFVYGFRRSAGKCRTEFESDNIRIIETPAAFGDLQGFGYVARDYGESERWLERYGRFILFNTGSRGPFPLANLRTGAPIKWKRGAAASWVDVVSVPLQTINVSLAGGLSLSRHAVAGVDPERVVMCPTVSFWPEMHCQSYFLSLPAEGARLVLFGTLRTPFASKVAVIFDGEVAGSRTLYKNNFSLFDLSRQKIAEPSRPLQGVTVNAYYENGILNTSTSVFVKYGGDTFEYVSSTLKDEVQRLQRRRYGAGADWGTISTAVARFPESICRHVNRTGTIASCPVQYACTLI